MFFETFISISEHLAEAIKVTRNSGVLVLSKVTTTGDALKRLQAVDSEIVAARYLAAGGGGGSLD